MNPVDIENRGISFLVHGIPTVQAKMNNPEKLDTMVHKTKKTKTKFTTHYALETTIRKQTQIT
jgi:hypothetical protein